MSQVSGLPLAVPRTGEPSTGGPQEAPAATPRVSLRQPHGFGLPGERASAAKAGTWQVPGRVVSTRAPDRLRAVQTKRGLVKDLSSSQTSPPLRH